MGKHKNRNRRGKSSQKSSNDQKKKKNVGEESSLANAPVILIKLRHADPQTRLAALTALLHRPTTIRSNNSKTKSPSSTSTQQQQDLMVFQAVREQVMDSNLTVASVAAACLEAYCRQQAACVVFDDTTDHNADFATAGWYLVLLGRVQEGYQHVVASRLEPNDNHNHNHNSETATQQTQWLSLVVASLSAMTCLVQENPIVTERLERTPSLRHDSFDMLWKWCSWTVSSSYWNEDDDPQQAQQQQAPQQRHVLQEHVTHLWHVLVEDNPQVVQPWYQERPEEATRILSHVYHWTVGVGRNSNPPTTATTATTLSDLSRLYLVGVLLAVRAQLPVLDDEEEEPSSSTASSQPRGLHQIKVAPLLHYLRQCLRIPPTTTTAMARTTLCQTYQHAKDQQDDSQLERTVVRQQSVKQEPARAIARRLKQPQPPQPPQQPQQPQHEPAVHSTQGTLDTMAMEDEGNENDNDQDNNVKRGELPTNRTDYAQEWQTALDEWRRNHVLLELALEMTANLTASLVPVPHDNNDSAHDDSTDMQVEPGPLDADLRRAFVDPPPTTTTMTRMEPFSSLLNHFTTQLALEWPPNVLRDLKDLQSKVSACVGHLVVQQPPVVGHGGGGDDCMVDDERTTWIRSLWNDLVAALDQQPVVASTLIVLLQSPNAEILVASSSDHQVSLRSDLNRLLNRVDQCSSAAQDAAATERDPVTAWRDCITLIGLLVCQMEHDAELNSRVCQSLIQSTQRACASEMTNHNNNKDTNHGPVVAVLAECLNVLMDIYGDDDRHPQVFEQLHVLNLFQTTVPRLKQHVNLARMRSSSSFRDDELETLQEIAHNASRFIQYKKGHAC